jgi:putative membrane protein
MSMITSISTAIAVLGLVNGAAFAQSVAKPTDVQIANIAFVTGVIDVTAAKLALVKSKNKDVIAFANDAIREHEVVNKQVLDLASKLNITPEDNETSLLLRNQAANKQSELVLLSGAAYDNAYVASEVAYHKTVSDLLETVLIPAAANSELKSLLQADLNLFQDHKQHAEHVATMLK